jgi:predicted dehydrogenase
MLLAGVVGVGHLGKFHAEKYHAIEDVHLLGVADISRKRAEALAGRLGVEAMTDYRDLIGRVDLVSVVVPTQEHFAVAKAFLEAGIHVLLEKPVTRTLEEADALIELARKKNLVLQVGHLERFNPAFKASGPHTQPPLFIEANRISPFPERGTDVDVVLDLMIHDIDLVLHLVGQRPRWIHAVGVPVVTSKVDIANVRMEFESGCVANLTASRISTKTERRVRLFQRDAYWSIDFGQRQVMVARRVMKAGEGLPRIETQQLDVPLFDALEHEIRSFIGAVRDNSPAVVDGQAGREALAVALDIMADIKARLGDWTFDLA